MPLFELGVVFISAHFQGDGISVLGGTGFIGRHLIDSFLVNRMGPIRVLTRNFHSIESRGDVIPIRGDMMSFDSVKDLVRDQSLVINMAYINNDYNANLCAADNLVKSCIELGVSRLIHCSTALVVGRVNASVVDESTTCCPYTEYERTKLDIEERLLERATGKLELVIVRPTAVFGSGGRNLVKLANSLLHRPHLLNLLPVMLFKNRPMHLVPVEDVVSSISFLATLDRDLNGERFIISCDEHKKNNYYDLANHLTKKFGRRAFPESFVPFAPLIVYALLKLLGRSQVNPRQVFDCGKLIRYGFAEKINFVEAIDRFADNFLLSQE